jgi:hypothetical protein
LSLSIAFSWRGHDNSWACTFVICLCHTPNPLWVWSFSAVSCNLQKWKKNWWPIEYELHPQPHFSAIVVSRFEVEYK